VGFDYERRHHAEYDQAPRGQAGIPKESVDHEPLLSSPGMTEYKRTIADLNNSQGFARVHEPSTWAMLIAFAVFWNFIGRRAF
jgi:hypothetical protein